MKNKKIKIVFFLIFLLNFLPKISYAENSIYNLTAIKILYTDNNQTIIAKGDAYAIDQFGKEISANEIIYDKKKSLIKTKKNSKYKDSSGNIIYADEFEYDLNIKKILANNNVKFFDKNNNKFNFSQFDYYENSEKGFGKNGYGILVDKSSVESPLIEIDNKKGEILIKNKNKPSFFNQFFSLFKDDKNRYTTCENTDNLDKSIKERCPDWSISTTKTLHDSSKKMIYHDHAVVKIRNFPVFYTPYFSHPDPSVQRKSGLLTPSTKNFEDLGRTLKTPYFWAINEKSDLTFTPIFYQNENSIYLAEYRNQNKNNKIAIDTSYSKGYKNLNKKGSSGENLNRTGGSRNHLYINFLGNYENLIFDENEIEFNLQRISQKNYLKVNQINTNYAKQDDSTLNNNLTLSSYQNQKKIKIAANVYENLSTDEKNNKYHYKLPSIEYSDFFNKYNYYINLLHTFESENFSGDSKKIAQINQINIESEQKILGKYGISNIFKTNIDNINVYNENIIGSKENLNNDIFGTIGLESSYPLIKFKTKKTEILTPKIFAKYTPGSMNDLSNSGKILEYNDIFSMNRTGSITSPETGESLGYGINYNVENQDDLNVTYLRKDFSIGQVLKFKKKKELPTTSSLNQKRSQFVGNVNLFYKGKDEIEKKIYKRNNEEFDKDIEEGMNLNYKFNIKNNFEKLLRNQIEFSYKNNNNALSTLYQELHEIGDTNSIEFKYKRNFYNNLNFIAAAKKNLKNNESENNLIELNYESDCLKIGISLAKTFYQNDDLKRDNNLTLFIMLKPFGQPIAPDLTNLMNN